MACVGVSVRFCLGIVFVVLVWAALCEFTVGVIQMAFSCQGFLSLLPHHRGAQVDSSVHTVSSLWRFLHRRLNVARGWGGLLLLQVLSMALTSCLMHVLTAILKKVQEGLWYLV